jgi:hypothetical protein
MAIDVKPIVIKEVICHDCLDSITSTSTVSLSTMLLLRARKNPTITEWPPKKSLKSSAAD